MSPTIQPGLRSRAFVLLAIVLAFGALTTLLPATQVSAAEDEPRSGDTRDESRFRAAIQAEPSFTDLVGFNARIEYRTDLAAIDEGVFGFSAGQSFCNATLIDPEWIITAAHCMYRRGIDEANQSWLGNFQIRIGSTDGTGGFVTTVKQKQNVAPDSPRHANHHVVIHPRYTASAGAEHDIALVQLATPAPASLQPARYSLEMPVPGDAVRARGWRKEGSREGPRLPKVAQPPQTFLHETFACSPNPNPVINSLHHLCITAPTLTEPGHSGMGWFRGNTLIAVHNGLTGPVGNEYIEAEPLSTLTTGASLYDENGVWLARHVPARVLRNQTQRQDVAQPAAAPRTWIQCTEGLAPRRADVRVSTSWTQVSQNQGELYSFSLHNLSDQPFDIHALNFDGSHFDEGASLGVWMTSEIPQTLHVPAQTTTEYVIPQNGRRFTGLFGANGTPEFTLDVRLIKEVPNPNGNGGDICHYNMRNFWRLSDAAAAPTSIMVVPTNGVEDGSLTIRNPSAGTVAVRAIFVFDRFVGIFAPTIENGGCDLSTVSTSTFIPPVSNPSLVLQPGQECQIILRHSGAFGDHRNMEIHSDAFERVKALRVKIENTSEYKVEAQNTWVATGQRVDGYSAGDQIAIAANVRASDLSGEAFVALNYSIGGQRFEAVARSSEVSGTTGWTEISTNFTVPSGAHGLEPMLVVNGAGSAHIDGFTVTNTSTQRNLGANWGFEKRNGSSPQSYWLWASNTRYLAEVVDKAPSPPLGDVSCDGVSNVIDALFIMQFVVGLRDDAGVCPRPSGMWLDTESADVNDDQRIDAVDALFIMQCTVGLRNAFCPTGRGSRSN